MSKNKRVHIPTTKEEGAEQDGPPWLPLNYLYAIALIYNHQIRLILCL